MKIGPYNIKVIKENNRHLSEIDIGKVDSIYEDYKKEGRVLVLGTLSGRSGTRWLCDIFQHHKNAAGATEKFVIPESFWRYVKYNKLPIDTSGIVKLIKMGIVSDWRKYDISLTFSPYFSHGINELVDKLAPEKIIFAINDPRSTVQSMYNKGLFSERYIRSSNSLALGFQPELKSEWSHFFGRIVPNGTFYETWKDLTRIGKISWWANRITTDIAEQLTQVNQNKIWIFDLSEADQNYSYYKKIAREFDLKPLLNESKFLSLKGRTVRVEDNVPHVWDEREEREFVVYTKEWHDIYHRYTSKN